MLVSGQWMYLLGGAPVGAAFDSITGVNGTLVFSCRLNGDGTIGPWQRCTDLPRPQLSYPAWVYSDYLYTLALNSGGTVHDVFSAPVFPNGQLGVWSLVGSIGQFIVGFDGVLFRDKMVMINNSGGGIVKTISLDLSGGGKVGRVDILPGPPMWIGGMRPVLVRNRFFSIATQVVGGAPFYGQICAAKLG